MKATSNGARMSMASPIMPPAVQMLVYSPVRSLAVILKSPRPCPSIIHPWSLPNTAVRLAGSTASPAIMLTTRLTCLLVNCGLSRRNGNKHVTGRPADKGYELCRLYYDHTGPLSSYNAENLGGDSDRGHPGLDHESKARPELFDSPSCYEEIKCSCTRV